MPTLIEEFFNGEELKKAVSKLPSRADRIAAYQARMDEITNGDWETPDTHYRDGSPQGLEYHNCTKLSGCATVDGIGQIGG